LCVLTGNSEMKVDWTLLTAGLLLLM
jgi:hypothetical protein